MAQIEVSQKWFTEVLVDKLKKVNELLIKADELTYSKSGLTAEEIFDVWHNVRQSNLEIENLIEALE